MKVLIVEDEKTVRTVCKAAIELGINVEPVWDRRGSPDDALLDKKLADPKLEGLVVSTRTAGFVRTAAKTAGVQFESEVRC